MHDYIIMNVDKGLFRFVVLGCVTSHPKLSYFGTEGVLCFL